MSGRDERDEINVGPFLVPLSSPGAAGRAPQLSSTLRHSLTQLGRASIAYRPRPRLFPSLLYSRLPPRHQALPRVDNRTVQSSTSQHVTHHLRAARTALGSLTSYIGFSPFPPPWCSTIPLSDSLCRWRRVSASGWRGTLGFEQGVEPSSLTFDSERASESTFLVRARTQMVLTWCDSRDCASLCLRPSSGGRCSRCRHRFLLPSGSRIVGCLDSTAQHPPLHPASDSLRLSSAEVARCGQRCPPHRNSLFAFFSSTFYLPSLMTSLSAPVHPLLLFSIVPLWLQPSFERFDLSRLCRHRSARPHFSVSLSPLSFISFPFNRFRPREPWYHDRQKPPFPSTTSSHSLQNRSIGNLARRLPHHSRRQRRAWTWDCCFRRSVWQVPQTL